MFLYKLNTNNSYKGYNTSVCNGWLRLILLIPLNTIIYLLNYNAAYKTLGLIYYIFSLQIKQINISTLSLRKL